MSADGRVESDVLPICSTRYLVKTPRALVITRKDTGEKNVSPLGKRLQIDRTDRIDISTPYLSTQTNYPRTNN